MKENLIKNSLSILLVVLLVMVFFLFIGIPLTDNVGNFDNVKKIYYADDITVSHQKIIDEFNELYKGRIEVIPIDLPYDKFTTNERKELLARSFRSKSDRIDLFAVDIIWVPRFAKWAEPISSDVEEKVKDCALDYALKPCYYHEKLVAVPVKIDIGTMYYRKDLLSTYPQMAQKLNNSLTWKELINLKHNISKGKSQLYTFQGNNYEGLICSFFEMILNQDRNYFKKENVLFNTKEARRALKMLVDLVNQHKISPKEVVTFNESRSAQHFVENDGYFLRHWPEFLIDYNRYYPENKKNLEFVRAPLPHFEGTENASVFGGWNLMISKFSNNKDAAKKFLQYLISEEAQKLFLEVGDAPPILKIFYENPESYSKHEFLKFYKNLFKSGVHRPAWIEYTRISDLIAFYVKQAIENKISVEDALLSIDETIEKENIVIR